MDYLTVFESVPIGGIEISTISPLFKYFGGLKPIPTPAGVPVAMMSPASKVEPLESSVIRRGTEKMNSPVLPSWRISPFTLVTISNVAGAASRSSMHGPTGQNVSRLLTWNHC